MTGPATPVALSWMCEAVAADSKPEKVTLKSTVFATESKEAVPKPVAGLVFGGVSLSPFKSMVNE